MAFGGFHLPNISPVMNYVLSGFQLQQRGCLGTTIATPFSVRDAPDS